MATVGINGVKTPVTKGSSGMATATLPNVCKMPGPPAPFVPVPLPNIGMSSNSPQGYSTSVQIEGQPVAIQGATFASVGDVASQGTGGGLVSSNVQGPTSFIGPGSLDVKIEGKNVQLLGDPMMNNGGPSGSPTNAATMGGVMQAPAAPAASDQSDSDDDSDSEPETLSVKIWLQDEAGQRMGGAPYKLVVGSETRQGNADGDGLVDEKDLPDADFGYLQWGKPGDAAVDATPAADGADASSDEDSDSDPSADDDESSDDDDDSDSAEFAFDKDVYFDIALDESGGVRRQLLNLGFAGAEDQQRAGFLASYGSLNADSDIDDAHGHGEPWPDKSKDDGDSPEVSGGGVSDDDSESDNDDAGPDDDEAASGDDDAASGDDDATSDDEQASDDDATTDDDPTSDDDAQPDDEAATDDEQASDDDETPDDEQASDDDEAPDDDEEPKV